MKPDFVGFEKLILGVLNSRLFWFFISHSSTSLGGAVRLMPSYLNDFSFPKVDSKNKKLADKIVHLVDRILESKAKNNDTAKLEKEIDNLVFQLYNITQTEQALINS